MAIKSEERIRPVMVDVAVCDGCGAAEDAARDEFDEPVHPAGWILLREIGTAKLGVEGNLAFHSWDCLHAYAEQRAVHSLA